MSTTFQPPPTGVPIMMDDPITGVPTISVIWQKYFVDMAALLTRLGATVTSFNTRTGAITLTAGDVTTALTFTPAALTPIDGTADTTDRVLGVGQSKFINVSAATSIPLYVACGDGQEYELEISLKTPTTSTSDAYLKPNNTTYAGAITYAIIDFGSGAGSGQVAVHNYFSLFPGGIYFSKAKITTDTLSKNMVFSGLGLNSGNIYTFNGNSFWSDSTTVYSSLGTLILPTANTGRILIRRIA